MGYLTERMVARSVLGVAVLCLGSGAAFAADCPAERAVYTMHSADDGIFRAQFIPSLHMATAASDFYFKLSTPQRSYWFGFSSSNGYGGITLLPISDPYAEEAREDGPRDLLGTPKTPEEEDGLIHQLSTLRFIALDQDLMELPDPPSSGDPAPPFLMMPEIGSALWYGPGALTDDAAAERDPMPRSAFKLTECLKEAPAKAWP